MTRPSGSKPASLTSRNSLTERSLVKKPVAHLGEALAPVLRHALGRRRVVAHRAPRRWGFSVSLLRSIRKFERAAVVAPTRRSPCRERGSEDEDVRSCGRRFPAAVSRATLDRDADDAGGACACACGQARPSERARVVNAKREVRQLLILPARDEAVERNCWRSRRDVVDGGSPDDAERTVACLPELPVVLSGRSVSAALRMVGQALVADGGADGDVLDRPAAQSCRPMVSRTPTTASAHERRPPRSSRANARRAVFHASVWFSSSKVSPSPPAPQLMPPKPSPPLRPHG